jgi:hypothetical protein
VAATPLSPSVEYLEYATADGVHLLRLMPTSASTSVAGFTGE